MQKNIYKMQKAMRISIALTYCPGILTRLCTFLAQFCFYINSFILLDIQYKYEIDFIKTKRHKGQFIYQQLVAISKITVNTLATDDTPVCGIIFEQFSLSIFPKIIMKKHVSSLVKVVVKESNTYDNIDAAIKITLMYWQEPG